MNLYASLLWNNAGLFNGRPVALKLLTSNHPDTVTRVKEEVQITAAVQHDNVVTTYCCLQLDKGSLMATGKVGKGGGGVHSTFTPEGPKVAPGEPAVLAQGLLQVG